MTWEKLELLRAMRRKDELEVIAPSLAASSSEFKANYEKLRVAVERDGSRWFRWPAFEAWLHLNKIATKSPGFAEEDILMNRFSWIAEVALAGHSYVEEASGNLEQGFSVDVFDDFLVVGNSEELFRNVAQVDAKFASLGAAELTNWVKLLDATKSLILDSDDLAWKEIRRFLKYLIPIEAEVEGSNQSGSCREVVGIVYLSYDRNPLVIAEALVHECAHSRLYLLEEAEPLVESGGYEPKYYSPWQNQLRPMFGILHAVYVFERVIRFLGQVLNRRRASTSRGPSNENEVALRLYKVARQLEAAVETGVSGACDVASLGARILDRAASTSEFGIVMAKSLLRSSERLSIDEAIKNHAAKLNVAKTSGV